MINTYSLNRPNSGGYYVDDERSSNEHIEPCGSGVQLSSRIGHKVQSGIGMSSTDYNASLKPITIENDTEIITSSKEDVHKRLFSNITFEEFEKAYKKRDLPNGWKIIVKGR